MVKSYTESQLHFMQTETCDVRKSEFFQCMSECAPSLEKDIFDIKSICAQKSYAQCLKLLIVREEPHQSHTSIDILLYVDPPIFSKFLQMVN